MNGNIYVINSDDWKLMIENVLNSARDLLISKNEQYGNEDKFHNFNAAAALAGTTPEMALRGMLAKHIVSVWDLIEKHEQGLPVTPETWDEKILDVINYMVILRAMIRVRQDDERRNKYDARRIYPCNE